MFAAKHQGHSYREWSHILKLCNMWGMQSMFDDAKGFLIDTEGSHGLSGTQLLALARHHKSLLDESEQRIIFESLVERTGFITDSEAVCLDGPMLAYIAAARERKVEGEEWVETQFRAYFRYINNPSVLDE